AANLLKHHLATVPLFWAVIHRRAAAGHRRVVTGGHVATIVVFVSLKLCPILGIELLPSHLYLVPVVVENLLAIEVFHVHESRTVFLDDCPCLRGYEETFVGGERDVALTGLSGYVVHGIWTQFHVGEVAEGFGIAESVPALESQFPDGFGDAKLALELTRTVGRGEVQLPAAWLGPRLVVRLDTDM